MELQKGERWRCQNHACKSEILVLASSGVPSDSNPRCSCGGLMRKPYVRPGVNSYPLTKETRRRFDNDASPSFEISQTRRAQHGEN